MKSIYQLLNYIQNLLNNQNYSNATCEELIVGVLDENLVFGAVFSVNKGVDDKGEYSSEMVSVNHYIPVTHLTQFSEIKLVSEIVRGLTLSLEEQQQEYLSPKEVH